MFSKMLWISLVYVSLALSAHAAPAQAAASCDVRIIFGIFVNLMADRLITSAGTVCENCHCNGFCCCLYIHIHVGLWLEVEWQFQW